MMLNNVINSVIVYMIKYRSIEAALKKNMFFKITVLHSCYLELRSKLINLCIKDVALQLATIQKKCNSSLVLFKNFYKKFRNTYFPKRFLLTANATRITEKESQRLFAVYCFNFYYFLR